MIELTTEERYQIYIDKYVGVGEEEKDDGSGDTVTGKRSMSSFLCRKRANDWFSSKTGEGGWINVEYQEQKHWKIK